jgi:EamA domain-containing membrane protein RarD
VDDVRQSLNARATIVLILEYRRNRQYLADILLIHPQSSVSGVFIFHEPFTHAHAVCFILIWVGLALVAIEAVMTARRSKTRGG